MVFKIITLFIFFKIMIIRTTVDSKLVRLMICVIQKALGLFLMEIVFSQSWI